MQLLSRLARPSHVVVVLAGMMLLAACAADRTAPSDDARLDDSIASEARRPRDNVVASVRITPSSVSDTVGESTKFSAKAYNASGTALANKTFTWRSTDTAIVSVSSAGYATAKRVGSANIIATSETVSGQASFTVTGGATITAPGTVSDLSVTSATDTSITLSFTEVPNGAGAAAQYDVRAAVAPLSWGSAPSVSRGTCSTPLAGTGPGLLLSCVVAGLIASTNYEFQMVAFRGTPDVDAVFGGLSNVASGVTTPSSPPPPPPPPAGGNVFFQEAFDNTGFGARGWYDNLGLTLDPSQHVGASGSSVLFHWPVGAQTPASGGAIRHKFTASNSLYLVYDVKYSSNWVGSGHSYHPHEFNVLSSLDGDWDGPANSWLNVQIEHSYQNGGQPRIQLQDSKTVNTAMGSLPNSLIGITENRSIAGCNGIVEAGFAWECWNDFGYWYSAKKIGGPVVFQPTVGPGYKGNWNHVEVYAQLNSIVGGIGIADGVLQYWFNGALVIDRHDVVFRTGLRATLQFKQFMIAPYIGDGSPVDQSMWVDNVTVAERRAP